MITVTIGDLVLNATEVPEGINGGGSQMLSVHQLIGGVRVVDSLGRSDSTIKFSGLFRGIASVDRVKYLDNLRVSGQQINFTYSSYSYRVVISDFTWTMKIAYNVFYNITLTVVSDLTQPVTIATPSNFSDAITGAFIAALDIVQAVFYANDIIVNAMTTLEQQLESTNINGATVSQIAAISEAIAIAKAAMRSEL